MRTLSVLPILVALLAAGCGASNSDPDKQEGAGSSAGSAGSAGSDGTGGTGGMGGDGGSGGEGPTAAETVCRLWNEGHVENEKVPWIAGDDICDHGTLSEVAIEDTLRRINMFRALSELPPVTENRDQREQEQACAVLMNANNALDHEPPPDWACWSEQGAVGAGSSNLSLGYPTPGDAIDGQMADVSVPDSVGHRRWLLGYVLGKVGIGSAGRATCVSVFDDMGRTDRSWTAYPPAGPAPIAMVTKLRPVAWSFHPKDGIKGAEVSMQRLPGGEEVAIESWIPKSGIKIPDAIIWQPPPVQAGESYRISITRPSKETVTYDVELVDCAPGT
ncbi:CAP domain-containing protein [Vulgatibacter incomptus]|uniref:SCP domain-containing protein n=1 Tax=Vulgatibacter incomptus TaxID=1391653 RepID=A0A0K1PHS1_9BACT|nr:CAP domain-containing protein [Vulgatibacter incomptus]AKU92659.1 hypothetical protein AKJ08_3046 [Vulgatibacter incomptus]